MYQEFYSHSTLLALPLLAMALFMGTFAFVVFRVLRRSGRDGERERHLLQLPLDEDEPRAVEGDGHA